MEIIVAKTAWYHAIREEVTLENKNYQLQLKDT